MKLSEVLSKAVDALEKSPWTSDGQPCEALRAIVPALVEFVAASHCFLSMDADPDYHDRVQRYKNAWGAVQDALKAAGVSCE